MPRRHVYNRERSVPRTYLTVAAILLGLSWFMTRGRFTLRDKGVWPMFLMGAGFMLMRRSSSAASLFISG
jgi:hypothetical protein